MTNATSFKNSSAYVGLLLGTITFFCLVFVFITRQATSEAINEVNSSAQNKAFKELLEGITYNNKPLKSCYLIDGLDKKDHKIYVAKFNDTPVAYITYYDVAGGYSTPFSMVASVDSRTVTINYVDVVEFNETPGLGDKILRKKGNYLDSFKGVNLSNRKFEVKKDGGDFDFFTGATVTPRAVVRSTRVMLERISSVSLDKLTPCEASDNGR